MRLSHFDTNILSTIMTNHIFNEVFFEKNTVDEAVSNVNCKELIAYIDARILAMLLMEQLIHKKSTDRKIMAYVLTIFEEGVEVRQM